MKSLSLHTFDAGLRVQDSVHSKYFDITQDEFFSRIKSFQTGWVIESANFSDIIFEPAGGNGNGQLKINSPFTFNDGGNDFNAQFKGSTDDNLLWLDAGTDRVGIGNAAPDEKLHVTGNIKASGTVVGSNLSGTNTGDQSLAAYLTSAAAAAAYQPLDSDLTTIASLTATTDNFLVSVSSAWASRTPSQVRTTLGLVIGTNVQAYDVDLDAWAAKTAPSGTVVGDSDAQTLSNKLLLVTAVPGSDLTASGMIITLTAGESLAFGDVGYIKSDGKVGKADADAIATSSAVVMALATIANDASGSFLVLGIARNDAWSWTVGGLIYLSTTAGGLTQTAPSGTDDVTQIIGVATHADRMLFNPQLVQVEHT